MLIYKTYDKSLYEVAKEMLLVDDVDNEKYLTGLFDAMYEDLSTSKSKMKKYFTNIMKEGIHMCGGIIAQKIVITHVN